MFWSSFILALWCSPGLCSHPSCFSILLTLYEDAVYQKSINTARGNSRAKHKWEIHSRLTSLCLCTLWQQVSAEQLILERFTQVHHFHFHFYCTFQLCGEKMMLQGQNVC